MLELIIRACACNLSEKQSHISTTEMLYQLGTTLLCSKLAYLNEQEIIVLRSKKKTKNNHRKPWMKTKNNYE
jgi:hypothetical protein